MHKLKKIIMPLAVACFLFNDVGCAAQEPHELTEPTEATEATEAEIQRTAPDFPSVMPPKMNKKALKKLEGIVAPSYNEPILPKQVADNQISILGEAEATQRQMLNFILKRNPQPKLNCTAADIVAAYYQECAKEGIRADIALCQALKETGFFNYGGDVVPEQNNFCGLGTTGGGVKGAYFSTPLLGVRAHAQHLLAYASAKLPSEKIVDPRYDHIRFNRPEIYGKTGYWTMLNGVWAVPGNRYGESILELWRTATAPDGSRESLYYASLAVKREGTAYAYALRGINYAAQGETAAAIADYSESLQKEPSAEVYYNRALCYETMGKTEAALQDYTAALGEDPEFSEARFNRANIKLAQGNYDEAVADFEEILIISPRTVGARNNIGIAHLRQKKYAAAWQDFYESGRINSTDKIVEENQQSLLSCVASR